MGYLWVIIKVFYTRKMARTTLTWISNSEKKLQKVYYKITSLIEKSPLKT